MGLRNKYEGLRQVFADAAHDASRLYKGLSGGFHPIRDYIWPFRILEALWAQRRVLYVLAAQPIIQAATIFCFPTAPDYLQDHGIDPAVAAELSDNPIRVRERSFGGMLHSYNDFPTILGMMTGDAILSEPVQAYAFPSRIGPDAVTMPAQDVTAAQVVAVLGNMTEEEQAAIECALPSHEHMRLLIAFHEFSHCHSENHHADTSDCETIEEENAAIANHAECDADARAIAVAVKHFNEPDIARTLLYARALNERAGEHDTALYVDATLDGRKPASEKDAMTATRDAFAQLDIYSRTHEVGEGKVARAMALQEILDDYPDLLSPLARRRAELFIEAAQHFFPAAFEKAQEAAPAAAALPVLQPPRLAPV